MAQTELDRLKKENAHLQSQLARYIVAVSNHIDVGWSQEPTNPELQVENAIETQISIARRKWDKDRAEERRDAAIEADINDRS